MFRRVIFYIKWLLYQICFRRGDLSMNKISKIIEAISYILLKLRSVDKIHIVKLMYLADKYHLMNYGRTITEDDFIALTHGPVGSKTMDVLEYDPYILGELSGFAQEMFTNIKDFEYIPGDKSDFKKMEMLSESDIEALEFSIKNFGKMDKWSVVDYTHTLPEWKKFEKQFHENLIKKESIKPEKVLCSPEDVYFNIPNNHIKQSAEILNGTFD